MENVESTKAIVLPDQLDDISIRAVQVDVPITTRPIMNASELVNIGKIRETVQEEADKFNEFFRDPKNLIINIGIA